MDIHEIVEDHFIAVNLALRKIDYREVEKAIDVLRQARKQDAFVWIVGNGGSAATASHLANDLLKRCKIRAISIPDLTASMLAYGNDDGWENMFWFLVGALARAEDVLISISCSGNSKNVTETARHFPSNYCSIILTGPSKDSVLVKEGARAVIHANDDDIKVQEDVHSTVCHAFVEVLENM